MISKGLGLATEIIIMAIVISAILLFLGIGLLLIIHACIVGRCFRNNNDSGNDQTGSNGRTSSLSKDDLEKLPSYDFIAKSKGTSPVDCAVCLDSFKAGDKCRMLPICKHSFHAPCVDEWLLKTPICPICRTSADSRTLSIASGESNHFSDISIGTGESLATDSSRNFSAASIEFTESAHTTIISGNEMPENQTNSNP